MPVCSRCCCASSDSMECWPSTWLGATEEIGVRISLGARQSQVLQQILREAGRMVALGIAIGLPIAWMALRLVSSMLFGVTTLYAVTSVLSIAVLVCAAFVAAFQRGVLPELTRSSPSDVSGDCRLIDAPSPPAPKSGGLGRGCDPGVTRKRSSVATFAGSEDFCE
jgi:FtsX-like permease family